MPTRILVVDDEPQFERLVRQRFRRQVRAELYELNFAENGFDALDKLRDFNADIVLSDINMPRMDGLKLLSELNDKHPEIRTVMVSAYGDMANIRTAMNRGAFDFVTKPVNFEDLETTINKTIEAVELAKTASKAEELQASNVQLRDLDKMKTRFFTNISHELRTPLTVITGMADQIAENPEKWTTKGLQLIRRNSGSLLNLVNQILDLSKLESGKLTVNAVNGDVMSYLTYIIESFEPLAQGKDIDLSFRKSVESLSMDFDQEHMLRIVSNLLSNAIKFTPIGGKVSVWAGVENDATMFTLSVKDTGVGIPADQLDSIFERFFQASSNAPDSGGTGIGLALTQELVKLMDGSITVESLEGEGATFTVRIPITNNAATSVASPAALGAADHIKAEAPVEHDTTQTWHDPEGDLPTLLIVEDTPDVLEYIKSCLDDQYNIITARDGQEGIDIATEHVPDLIISDVMMPRKDGFELCATLKTNTVTSHIPIVLLTAKSDADSRIEGLTRGADAYLPKPFNRTELTIRLRKLLELRRILQERYHSAKAPVSTDDPVLQVEDAFIERIRNYVQENIDDENLSITSLCKTLRVSRSQLHNKTKALTGQSATGFVRSIRLNKARDLLRRSDLNISQIAYEVGFGDPAYFTRTFTKKFGESPKKVRESMA